MTRIKELRRQRGVTQEKMAALIGITRGAYANIENGKREPDIKTMITLADYFDVSLDCLMGRAEKKGPAPVAESESAYSPEYKFLSPVNKEIADRLIADLVKSQPSTPTVKLYSAASDGGRYETEADADITLPHSVQVLPDEYKGKTGGKPSAPEET